MVMRFAVSVMAGVLALAAGGAYAEDQPAGQKETQVRKQEREQIYGRQLMSPEERVEYRAKMRAAKTREEREAIRAEHHEKMKERAREKGVTLPDEPPAKGGGVGPGGGMGSGGGMGGGRRGGY